MLQLNLAGLDLPKLRYGAVAEPATGNIDEFLELIVEALQLIQYVGDGRSHVIDDESAINVDRIPAKIFVASRAHQVPGNAIAAPIVRPATVPAAGMLARKPSPLARDVSSRIDAVHLLAAVVLVAVVE